VAVAAPGLLLCWAAGLRDGTGTLRCGGLCSGKGALGGGAKARAGGGATAGKREEPNIFTKMPNLCKQRQ
jgi:hypothetical protein